MKESIELIERAKRIFEEGVDESNENLITSDDDYYLYVGLIVQSLISNKITEEKVNDSIINDILNSKDDKKLKKNLTKLFMDAYQSNFSNTWRGLIISEIMMHIPEKEIPKSENAALRVIAGFNSTIR